MARVDARELLRPEGRTELGEAKSYAVAAVQLRGRRPRPDRVGRRAAPRRSGVPLGDGDDLPAAHRYDVHPVREPARLLDPDGASSSSSTRTASTSARRRTATSSSWPACRSTSRRARPAGRASARAREVRPRVRARMGADGAARRRREKRSRELTLDVRLEPPPATNGGRWLLGHSATVRSGSQLLRRAAAGLDPDRGEHDHAAEERRRARPLRQDEPDPERAEHDLEQRDQRHLGGRDQPAADRRGRRSPSPIWPTPSDDEQHEVVRPDRARDARTARRTRSTSTCDRHVAGAIDTSRRCRVITSVAGERRRHEEREPEAERAGRPGPPTISATPPIATPSRATSGG